MKYFVNILIFICFGLLFMRADGCGGDENQEFRRKQPKIEAEKDSIKLAFTSETLTLANLKAFEESVTYKFTDFTDYYRIYTDYSVAPEFRYKAGEMIRCLFLSENCRFSVMNNQSNYKSNLTLAKLLATKINEHSPLFAFKADSMWVQDNLSPISDTAYMGILGFTSGNFTKNNTIQTEKRKRGTARFYATKKKLIISNDTLKIWTVLIGDVEL